VARGVRARRTPWDQADLTRSALEMGAVRHRLPTAGATERRPAGLAAVADGTDGAGVPGVREFRGLYQSGTTR
jgi:hypothetical protein